jgi:protein ImuB
LLECANAFSPRIESASAGTVVFDVEGLERLFGSYSEIAARIAEQTATRGLQANVSVASNADAAICAARGFAGITVLPRGSEAKRLADLPLAVLAPAPEILETLERWGIRTLGSFAKLPAVQVSERLGQEGVQLHKRARGTGSRLIVPHNEPLQFIETMDLDYEIHTIEPLTFILARMLEQICARLRARNLATHEIHLSLNTYSRVLSLPLPVRNPKLLTKLLILDLEAHQPGAPVRHVSVEAVPVKPRVAQNGLFVPLSPEPEKLELTLARLAAVVGEKNVGSPEILDTHRPGAFRVNHFSRGLREPRRLEPIRERQPRLSIRYFRPPLDATVQTRNSVPNWIALHGVHGPIETANGPWRTSGDW